MKIRELFAALLFAAQPAVALEKFSIPSLDGKLQLHGYWFGALAAEPRPAVISLHGCGGLLDAKGGLSRNRHRVAEYFNVERIHFLAIDSFTPRGLKSVCETRVSLRSIDQEDRRDDVFAAIRWLAQRPDVDRNRIAVLGYSNGGATVLSVVDRTEKMVRAQPIQPRAAVAFYPSCVTYNQMWSYQITAPLLVMIGALDDWTPPHHCQWLRDKVRRAQEDARFELIVFPDSHHGFDGYGPIQVRTGLPTKSGSATVGANPEARFNGHRYVVPPDGGCARADDATAVPLSEKGRERYAHYLGLQAPKAFAITEKGGWYFRSDDTEAMRVVMELCARSKVRCWLYAVDHRVVWTRDQASRIDAAKLERSAPRTKALAVPE